ncbi:MAG TPA: hypothetical protein PLB26_12535 [Rubrivivax sp.]|nr:hypothetical protein [Rubrivivax sp.]
MVDKDGNSVQCPNRPDNGCGYQVDFDAEGENSTHRIDFASLGELLYHLHLAAKSRGSELTLVVLQRELRPRLFQAARGQWLKEHVPFPNWDDPVRHDDHIHVNFAVQCK